MGIVVAAVAAAFASVAFAFFAPLGAWIPIGLVAGWLLYTLAHLRARVRIGNVPEISTMANTLLRKHAHFYLNPHAGQAFSSLCSGIALAGAAVGIIEAFRFGWIYLIPGAAFYLVMPWAARSFNPTRHLTPAAGAAHNEILDYLSANPATAPSPGAQQVGPSRVIQCDNCGQRLRVPSTEQRLAVRCPKCGDEWRV